MSAGYYVYPARGRSSWAENHRIHYRDAETALFAAAADVPVLGTGYSLLNPVLSFVTVKLPSVRADTLMKCAGWFVGVESMFAMKGSGEFISLLTFSE